MTDAKDPDTTTDLVLEYELEAPAAKVWRAVSIAEFREKWLPNGVLVDGEPVSSTPREEIRYRIRDDEPPFLESIVTFQVRPDAGGGTRLRIIHRLTDARLGGRPPTAANSNRRCFMRAA